MLSVKDVIEIVTKMTAPIRRAVQLSVGRCVLEAITDADGIQTVKVSLLEGEVKEMERFQQYGLTSMPVPDSAEGVCVFVGGNREHGICIAIDDRTFRLKGLSDGQVALYDSTGQAVIMKNDGTIDIGTGVLEKLFKSETFQSTFNSHTHTTTTPGNPTSPPIIPSTPLDLSLTVLAGV